MAQRLLSYRNDKLTLLVVATPPSDTDTTETLMRAARYDRNFEARTPQGFRLGVAFDAGVPESTKAAERFAATARLLQASGSELAPAWVELVELEDGLQLYRWLKEHHVSALYVPEALHSSVPAIVSASEAAGVPSRARPPTSSSDWW